MTNFYKTFLICFGILFASAFSQNPEGFASMDVLGQNGTSGGVGGEVVVVSSFEELNSLIVSSTPYIIHIADTIDLGSMLSVNSNKTILGLGKSGVIRGSGFNISGASNIIIRNLHFMDSNDDGINVQSGAHHVWIDHCDFSNPFDGALDIKRGSDYITVSWNHFYDVDKTCLLGHDDNNGAQDSTFLKVTYHHNWFDGTVQRHPRVRFSGLAHIYNNYYDNNSSYGVASTMYANVLVEGNYFLSVNYPTRVGVGESLAGDLVERKNVFDNCANSPQTQGEVPEPPYDYQLDDSSMVDDIVQAGAGRAGYKVPEWIVYDGSVLPNLNMPAFASENETLVPDTTTWIINDPDKPGNYLLQFINDSTGSKNMWGIDWEMNGEQGATIAFRVKPIDDTHYDRSFEIEYRDGSLRERMFLKPGGEVELDRADVTAGLSENPDDWHIYRITYVNGISNVYIDEDPTPFLSGTSSSVNTGNDLRFGDGSESNTYGFLLDWIIYDTSGVYAPGESDIPDSLKVDEPEPEALSWLVYSADVLPNLNNPAYASDNETNVPDITTWIIDDPDIEGNSIMQFINDSTGSKNMWGIDWEMNAEKGATIAFRVKPIDDNTYDRSFEVEFRDGNLRERMFLKPGGEIELDRADVTAKLDFRTDDWHTYRITYLNGVSTIYIDEYETPFLTGTSSSANSGLDLRFGDGSESNTYGFLLDWMIFDTTGVYAPGEREIPDSLFIDSPGPKPRPWQIYDASVLPNQNIPIFVVENDKNLPDTLSWIVDDPDSPENKLLLFIDSEENSKGMWGISWSMSPAKGATFAFRMKPYNTQLFERTFEIEFRDGIVRERMFLLPGGIVELNRADTSVIMDSGVDDWHTYRITFQDGKTAIYLNENPEPFLTGISTNSTGTIDLRFGDGSDGDKVAFYLDWLVYETEGAFAPGESFLPEGLIVDTAAVGAIVVNLESDFSRGTPVAYELKQNYPNPFNPSTTIGFSVPETGQVNLSIYNIAGQLVENLVDNRIESGYHTITFNADKYSSGIYFYRLKAKNYIQTKKMLLVK